MSSEATQTVGVYDVLAWLETNKKTLAIGFVTAVVIGFGIAIYRYTVDQKELAASDALLRLKAPITATDSTPAPEASAYLTVANHYQGTSAAERALLLAGSALFAENKYSEAQVQFTRFLNDHGPSAFAATAAYGIAACLEAQHKPDEALSKYQNLSVRYPNSSVLDDAKLAVARIYESQNKPELALRIYEELGKASAMGSAGSEALTRKADLLAKHPELAVTNAVSNAAASTLVVPATTNGPAASNAPAVKLTNAPAAKR